MRTPSSGGELGYLMSAYATLVIVGLHYIGFKSSPGLSILQIS